MHTDRQPTIGEVGSYAASQGQAFAGFPTPTTTSTTTTTTQPPPEPLVGPPRYVPPEVQRMEAPGVEGEWAAERTRTAPAPVVLPAPRAQVVAPPNLFQAFGGYDMGGGAALSQALAPPVPAAPVAPGTGTVDRVAGVLVPQRSFSSQAPAIIGSTVLGRVGTSLANEAGGPMLAAPVGIATAGLGGGLGEGGRILYEKATGAEPAEPGGALKRIGNAAIRSATFEGLTWPARYPAALASKIGAPTLVAADELRPVLTDASHPLGNWFQTYVVGQAPKDATAAWADLGAKGQAELAGDSLGSMRTIMGQVAKAGAPISYGDIAQYGASTTLVPTALVTGHGLPYATAAAVPAARAFLTEAVPKVESDLLRSPGGLEWLGTLRRAGLVAGPVFGLSTRGAAQSVGAGAWPPAEVAFPGPPPKRP